MTGDQGSADGYTRKYKSTGYVDRNGNELRRYKDKKDTSPGIVIAAVLICIIGGVLGNTASILGWVIAVVLVGAVVLGVLVGVFSLFRR